MTDNQNPTPPVQGTPSPEPPVQAPSAAPEAPVVGSSQVPPASTPQVPQTAAQPAPPELDGKATGAMVCGILSILTSGTVLISIALAVVAIVLAGSVLRAGTNSKAKAGKICGIIGIVLSVISLLLYVLMTIGLISYGTQVAQYDYTSSNTNTYSPSSPSSSQDLSEADKQAITDAVNEDLDLSTGSVFHAEASYLETGFLSALGLTANQLGWEENDFGNWAFSNFDYKITDIKRSPDDPDKVVVSLDITSHDWKEFTRLAESKVNNASDMSSSYGSIDEYYVAVGMALKEAMAETPAKTVSTTLDAFSYGQGNWEVSTSSLFDMTSSVFSGEL